MRSLSVAFAAFVLVLTAPSAYSADRNISSGELRTLISGKSVSFAGSGRATYNADGSYVYRGGGVFRGTWRVSSGKACVVFKSGARRCDRYVKNGSKYYLINSAGKKFRATIR